MEPDPLYEYKLRPAYGREELLIEFYIDYDDEYFYPALLNAIHDIHPVYKEENELAFLNDSTEQVFTSDQGNFSIAIDIWGFVFIMAHDNQQVIYKISELLESDKSFSRKDIDLNNYKLK